MQYVEHPRYGRGVVVESRYNGLELRIKFEDGITRWIRREFVRFLSKAPVLETCKHAKITMPARKFRAASIIEALRMGVVPHGQAEEFTVGREDELGRIKAWLDNPQAGTLQIVGEYGTGKTHLLNCIYLLALREGWAVSYVELDHMENPPYRPRSVYGSIVESFRFGREGEGDFRKFLQKVAISKSTHEILEHPLLGKIIRKIREDEVDEDDWEWIEGKLSKGYRKYNHSTSASIYCNILSGIGWAAKKLGLRGFMVLFDEAENVDLVQYRNQFKKGWNFLSGLVLLSNSTKALLWEDILYTSSGYIGEETGLQYYGFRTDIRFAWRIPSNLKLVFAFTPGNLVNEPPFDSVERIELEHLRAHHFNELLEKIKAIYKEAYDFEVTNEDLRKFEFPPHTRSFIKACVEAMDILRLGGAR